jgi:hypothetical protein
MGRHGEAPATDVNSCEVHTSIVGDLTYDEGCPLTALASVVIIPVA